jgi:beta-lactamase regulating signal transducer with metallopeptidase domain
MESLSVQLWPFFEWLLRTTVQGSLFILLIVTVQALLRQRLGARLRYCLWLLLLIRLVLPWAPESRISLSGLLPGFFERTSSLAPSGPAAEATGEVAVRQSQESTIVTILPIIWLAGASVLAGCMLTSNILFWRRIRRSRRLVDPKILRLLADCKSQMGIRRSLKVHTTDAVNSPALFGFLRPRLLLPTDMLTALGARQLRHIFLHELAHLRHLDIVASHLVSVLQILHWFNPLVWLAFYRMRADRELACDELVLSNSNTDEPTRYGRTIISLVERFRQNRYMPAAVGIMENKSQLKRRIAMIARFKKLPKRESLLALVVLAVIAAVALTNAASSSKTKADNNADSAANAPEPMGYAGYGPTGPAPQGYGGYGGGAGTEEDDGESAPMMYVGYGGGGSADAPLGYGGYGGGTGTEEDDGESAPMVYGGYGGGGSDDAPKGFGGGTAYFATSRSEAEPNEPGEPEESE